MCSEEACIQLRYTHGVGTSVNMPGRSEVTDLLQGFTSYGVDILENISETSSR
jgi:hypothetical protein